MQSLKIVLDRFMRLLPFLTTPNSYRRFHHELMYPYPDVWDSPEIRTREAAERARRERDAAAEARSYLTFMDLNRDHAGRREPFC